MASLIWFPDEAWAPPPGGGPATFNGRLFAVRAPQTHVLMIEDDTAIAEMYRLQFEHDGYRVTIATTGEVAETTMTADSPDVVLLDLLLPDRSGFDILASLNERLPNHPPVVILSNYGEPGMIDRGRALGAVEYIVKSRVTPVEISRQIPIWAELGRGGGRPES